MKRICECRHEPAVLWLAVTPTSYNNFYLSKLNESLHGRLHVAFAARGIPDGTWPPPGDVQHWFYRRPQGLDVRTLQASLSRKYALVLVCGWNDPTKRLSLTLLAAKHRRYVIWTDTPHSNAGWRRALRNLAVRTWTRGAVAVLGTGQPGVTALEQMGIQPEKIVNFPFWVDKPSRNTIINPNEATVRFCSVGRLVPRKGMDRAIRALALAGPVDATLDIVGTGPQRQALETLARDLGISQRVRFLGSKSASEMDEYLSNEPHCLIHAAPEHDPYPVVVLEAMAHGLAIIATNCSGSAIDRVEEGKSGFIVPFDAPPQVFADCIRQLTMPPGLLYSMRCCARAKAAEWPVERGVQMLLDLASGADKQVSLASPDEWRALRPPHDEDALNAQ